jgi:hypothetical protein
MDVVCFDDLDEFGRDLDDPLEELMQDVVHMLFESFGTNPDAIGRSIGLDDALSGPADPNLRRRIEQKLAADPRIFAAQATISKIEDGRYQIDLKLQVNQQELGVSLAFDSAGNVTRLS